MLDLVMGTIRVKRIYSEQIVLITEIYKEFPQINKKKDRPCNLKKFFLIRQCLK